MATPPKRKVQGGRVTPKGARPVSENFQSPKSKKSPKWVSILLFSFLVGGATVIIINYLGVFPGGASNWWLLGGLGLILAGVVTATKLH